jgi:hypothetical protein
VEEASSKALFDIFAGNGGLAFGPDFRAAGYKFSAWRAANGLVVICIIGANRGMPGSYVPASLPKAYGRRAPSTLLRPLIALRLAPYLDFAQ